jgi:magnesium transporter
MMRAVLYAPSTKNLVTGGEEIFTRWEKEPESILWVDLCGMELAPERVLLQERFGIHALAIQDAQRTRHPPKLEVFEDVTFLLFKALHSDAEDIEFSTIQLALFIGPRFIVTRHNEVSMAVNQLWEDLARNPGMLADGPGLPGLRLSRIMVDHYLKHILRLESRIEELEEQMLDGADDTMLAELIRHKGNLKKLRRVFVYHQQIFSDLRVGSCPGVGEQLAHEAVDVYEQQERANSLAALYYELASDLIDGYISLASHRLNQIVKVLTIITVIFVPLGLVAGIYGMNFENMPELHSPIGYYSVLAVMGLIATTLLLVFRKKKWV